MDDLQFRKELRIALNHLHNRDHLRQSPLIELFGLSARFDASAALQRILMDGIEALRPPPGEQLHSPKRLLFDTLLYRYIQQFKQGEVANHIGMSNRQFRREQDNAIETLAIQLWKSHHLERLKGGPAPMQATSEWDWLSTQVGRASNLPRLIDEILAMMAPIAVQSQVKLTYSPVELPDLEVHPVALRQIMLNLLQAAIHYSSRGEVELAASKRASFVDFQIQARQGSGPADEALASQDSSLIKIATHLASLSKGRLSITQANCLLTCSLSLPVAGDIEVLVVDDNIEIIELLTRYAARTGYHLVGVQEPEEAVDMAIYTKAQIIVLDVMMPRVDGWELLGALRRHPQTAHVPVIILSILAQEELARSLGARALVLKPVTQEQFLGALDEISAEMRLTSQ
jgi:CheY-like chemotaxis protein